MSKEEKERRKKENLCLYCGSLSHLLDACPKKGKNNKTLHSFMSVQRKIFRERQTELIQDCHIPYYDDDNLPKIVGIGGRQSIIGITLPVTLRYKGPCLSNLFLRYRPTTLYLCSWF